MNAFQDMNRVGIGGLQSSAAMSQCAYCRAFGTNSYQTLSADQRNNCWKCGACGRMNDYAPPQGQKQQQQQSYNHNHNNYSPAVDCSTTNQHHHQNQNQITPGPPPSQPSIHHPPAANTSPKFHHHHNYQPPPTPQGPQKFVPPPAAAPASSMIQPPPPPIIHKQQQHHQFPNQNQNQNQNQILQQAPPPPSSPYYQQNSHQPPPPHPQYGGQQYQNQQQYHQLQNQNQQNQQQFQQVLQHHQQFPSSAPLPQAQSQYEKRSTNLLQERNVLPSDGVKPTQIRLPHIFEHKDVNCGPDLFRSTLTAIPQTQELLKKARLPLGMVIHPFKDMKQLSVLQSSIIVRCRSCRTYINPFVVFPDPRHWRCNVCGRTNDLPEEFHFDPATKTYGEPGRRPEIKNATVEFIAPSEYMVRPPQASAYIFLLDVTANAIETGYLEEFCTRLIENLDHLPGDHRTSIALMAVDSQIRYFLFRDNMQPKELIVSDIEDSSFLPWNQGLLVNLREKKEALKQFLQQLPSHFASNKESNFALGAGLQSAYQILADVGGRITVFQSTLSNIGPGALTSREDPNLRAAKEIANLGPETDFYKKLSLETCSHQVAMDLFLFSSSYADVSTLCEMSRFCGGCVHYYPGMHAVRNPLELERFSGDLARYLSRKIGWEAVLRIRCSKGLSLHTFYGNFFVRSTDLLALANVNPDAAFGVQVQMDDNLYDYSTVTFQAALLYTSSRGERRIRVHTLCLPVTSSLAEVQQGADVHTVVSMLAKMAADRSVASNVPDAREAMVNACVDALGSYASSFAASQRVGALLAPESLKLLPLYVLGLLKHPAFAYGTSIKLDHRTFAMNSFRTMPHYYLIRQIYPDLYALHFPFDQTSNPPVLHLSYEKIDSHGAYLMDTGTYLYLYVCQSVGDAFCRQVLGVATFGQIDEEMAKLPDLDDNPQSTAIRSLLERLRSSRPFYAPLRIIREDSINRELFISRLVDDRSESTFSYVEFLQHLHKELNPR